MRFYIPRHGDSLPPRQFYMSFFKQRGISNLGTLKLKQLKGKYIEWRTKNG